MFKRNPFLILFATTALVLLLPSLIYLSICLMGSLQLTVCWQMLLEQFRADHYNLLGASLIWLFPALLILLGLGVRQKWVGQAERHPLYAWGGCVPVILLCVWVNISFWRKFLPAQTFLGFPHGLELVIVPVFFAPVAIMTGWGVIWLLFKTERL